MSTLPRLDPRYTVRRATALTEHGPTELHERPSAHEQNWFLHHISGFLSRLLAAQAESVKDSLDRQYKKQLLALRFPFSRGDLKFDSAGRPLHPPPAGPWLKYGGIFVEKLGLSDVAVQMNIEVSFNLY